MKNILLSLSPLNACILSTLFTFLVTSLGAAIVFMFRNVNKKIMNCLLGFASGVMISASFFSLINPALEYSIMLNYIPYIITTIGFICGGLFLYFSDKFLEKNIKVKSNKSFKRMFMLIFSITLHNIPEGMAIGVAFGSLYHNYTDALMVSAYILALGIGIQNFPEGSAISLPLKREGVSSFKSFVIGSLSGIVEILAGIIGVILVMKVKMIMPFLLTFAAGAMIYVVSSELIPEASKEDKDLVSLFTIIGFAIMMFLDIALS